MGYYARFFIQVLRIKLRSPCLPSNYLTELSLQPLHARVCVVVVVVALLFLLTHSDTTHVRKMIPKLFHNPLHNYTLPLPLRNFTLIQKHYHTFPNGPQGPLELFGILLRIQDPVKQYTLHLVAMSH